MIDLMCDRILDCDSCSVFGILTKSVNHCGLFFRNNDVESGSDQHSLFT